jgi:hypothetical protein
MRSWKWLLLLLSLSSAASGQQVTVDAAGRTGSAVLLKRGTDCFAITADHVVHAATGITLADIFNRHVGAFIEREYPDADLVILEVEDHGRTICAQANWPSNIADIENVLQNAHAVGKLTMILADASSTAEIPVSINSYNGEQIVVSPSNTTASIARGWSGSSLYVSQRLVGILTDVDPTSGRGTVSRIDHIETIICDFLRCVIPPGDQFIQTVRMPQFDERLRSMITLFESNRLETLRGIRVSGDQGPQDKSGTQTFNSTVQLPAFSEPGTLDFHNKSGYRSPMRLDKHPLNMVYTQSFLDLAPSKQLLKARFDALSAAVGNVVTSSWTRNSYSDGYARRQPYEYRDEYSLNGMRILISLDGFKLEIEFLPAQ